MLDVIGHLLALPLVQMPDIIIELLDILPLQISVTVLLLIFYNFYMKNTAEKSIFPETMLAYFFIMQCCVELYMICKKPHVVLHKI